MSRLLSARVAVRQLASALNLESDGSDVGVMGVCALHERRPFHLSFTSSEEGSHTSGLVVFGSDGQGLAASLPHPSPRRIFAHAVRVLRDSPGFAPLVQRAVGSDVRISRAAYIGENVSIGAGTVIEPGAVVLDEVTIGCDCHIRAGVIIGDAGFGFTVEPGTAPEEFPQIGGVYIGDHVVIGTGSTVAAGTLAPTIVESHVKTDNLVHIAHNCHLGTRSILTACAELSGGVTLGPDVWLGPNCSIKEKVVVGEGAIVGIGSVVIRDVAAWTVVGGNPARHLRDIEPPEPSMS